MNIYDPIAVALGIEPSDMDDFYSQPLQKTSTNWNRIPWNKGKKYKSGPYPKEWGDAISLAKKGKPINMRGEKHPRSKPIYCITTDEHFASGGDAIRKYPNMSRQNLSHHLNGKQKTIDGKVFTYSTLREQCAPSHHPACEEHQASMPYEEKAHEADRGSFR